jgi:RNA polymerase sigma-70 factor (ECF subfamily)
MATRDLTVTEAASLAVRDSQLDVALQMDEEAFRGFYDRTARMVWAYLHRVTGDPHAADDLLQEAFYRFLRADARLETESHRRHYLFRIATNLAHDRFRRAAVRPVHVAYDDTGADRVAAPARDVDQHLDLTQAMAQLGHRERAMLWLAYGQGASHEEIAGVMRVKTASVKALLFRARRRLAALLGRGTEAR